ncbi:maleylacetoacetate isomerase [Polaromonas hydrogenivorans]
MLVLHTYFRSSASYRVRIALALKGLAYESVPVHLVRGGGEQHSAAFATLNPAELVPVLVDGEVTLTQSLPIIEYLDEVHPAPALLPPDAAGRARVRAIAQTIACEIHPLNNLRVLQHLEATLGASAQAKSTWYAHWVALGFTVVESMLSESAATGRYCHGDTPTLADCCLVPQIYNAERFGVSLAAYPTLRRIGEACMKLPAFQRAAPEAQADAA